MTRRDLAWLLAQLPAVASAQGHNHSAPPEPDRWSHYRPRFFSAEDFQALDAFTAILIPADDTPGAREAHVAPFLDFLVDAAAEHAPEMQSEWRKAMDWLRGRDFSHLSPDRQLALVEQMSAPERDRRARHEGYPAYRLIKRSAIFAFYTSRAGLVETLEYQGNAYLERFPACDHPEHRKV
jgi:hypothetical protein